MLQSGVRDRRAPAFGAGRASSGLSSYEKSVSCTSSTIVSGSNRRRRDPTDRHALALPSETGDGQLPPWTAPRARTTSARAGAAAVPGISSKNPPVRRSGRGPVPALGAVELAEHRRGSRGRQRGQRRSLGLVGPRLGPHAHRVRTPRPLLSRTGAWRAWPVLGALGGPYRQPRRLRPSMPGPVREEPQCWKSGSSRPAPRRPGRLSHPARGDPPAELFGAGVHQDDFTGANELIWHPLDHSHPREARRIIAHRTQVGRVHGRYDV